MGHRFIGRFVPFGFNALTGVYKWLGKIGKGLVSSTIVTAFVGFGFWKYFGITFLESTKATLLRKASPLGLHAGYLLTAWQYYNLFRSIFTTPDFENSRWILY